VAADRGVGSWIDHRALIAPDQPALLHGETTRTYGELASRVRRVAGALRDLGVARGDRVAWLGDNHPAFVEVFFAAAKLAAVLAPVNHRLEPRAVDGLLDEYSARVAVVEREAMGVALPRSVRTRVVVGAPTATDRDVGYEQLTAGNAEPHVEERIRFDEVCLLTHTSGTTGAPKGVMLTHGNVTWNVVNLLSLVDFRSDDVTVAIAPFFRTGGTGVNVLPVLFKGGTVVIPETHEPAEILRLLEERRVTIGFGNPDLLDALTRLDRWPTADLASIRCFITGGAPVPDRLIRLYMDRAVPFFQGYGLSEAAPFVLLLDAPSALRKVGSAGKPPLFVDVRTVRTDGAPCGPNETGELQVRGPNVMAGYWNRPDATRSAVDEDGWLHTGDAARVDDDGYFWIVDRVVDAYEIEGHVVYPGDVERKVAEHAAVLEVGVAADGGTATAFVVLRAGATVSEAELLDFCGTVLPPHAVPSSIEFLDELPRSSVGKLLRHELTAVAS